MKLIAVAIYDAAVGAYARPFFMPSIGMAMRSFEDEAVRQADDNPMYKHGGDFALFELGVYDDAVGRFENLEVPRKLVDALSVQMRKGEVYASSTS